MGGFNILKTYPELLEILGLSETEDIMTYRLSLKETLKTIHVLRFAIGVFIQ